ncbi:hypothetical protein ACO0SA_002607 [Hanseniaspora valbyensis]
MDSMNDIVERDPLNIDFTIQERDISQDSSKSTGFPSLSNKKTLQSWRVRLQEKKINERKQQRQQQQQQKEQENNISKNVSEKTIDSIDDFEIKENDPAEVEAASTETNKKFDNKDMSEAERIHLENINLMMNMSSEQITHERQEIMDNMNPKVLEKLIKRFSAKNKISNDNKDDNEEEEDMPLFTNIDTNKYWVGGTNIMKDLPKLDDSKVDDILNVHSKDAPKKIDLRHVKFEDDMADLKSDNEEIEEEEEEINIEYPPIENEDDYATDDYQILQKMKDTDSKELLKDVHFVTKKQMAQYEPLSIDDPEFEEKLKEKYFPDLPAEIDKLKWMENEEDSNITNNKVIDTVADLRFDFKGNLCAPQQDISTTKDGLHHHAENPDLKGYTLEELQTYALSTYPGQKCIALQTLGRIMYKIKAERYYQLIPEIDQEQFDELNGDITPIIEQIYGMLWSWLKHLKIVEIIESNLNAKNLSIKNYATEAIWMLKQGEYKQKQIQEKRRSLKE